MDVSNKTYRIKDIPSFQDGEKIVGDFVSANHLFNEISIQYENGWEIYYLNRNDPDNPVHVYVNGIWDIEYCYLTFEDDVDLEDDDFQALTGAYDEYPNRLRFIFNGQTNIGKPNDILKGSITWENVTYLFDNREYWPTALLSIAGVTISTPKEDGVTKYKVYSNGNFIGYIDSNNVWRGEVSV